MDDKTMDEQKAIEFEKQLADLMHQYDIVALTGIAFSSAGPYMGIRLCNAPGTATDYLTQFLLGYLHGLTKTIIGSNAERRYTFEHTVKKPSDEMPH